MPVPVVTLEGRVVGDVQFRFVGDTALPLARFRMVCIDRKRGDNGNWVDGDEFWITVSCFRTLATYVADSVNDKDQVIVTGKLTTATWFDDAGAKQSAPKVVANNVGISLIFAARPATDSAGHGTRQHAPAPRPQQAQQRASVPASAPRNDSQGSDESWGVSEPWTGPGTQDDPWA
jgi:single-strand DNA-binding protein